MQGAFDHWVFLTTSRFAREAIESSAKNGAITILLFDRERIAEEVLQRGMGVRRKPLSLLNLDEELFDFEDV